MMKDIETTVRDQRVFFRTGTTLDVRWRLAQLRKLRDSLVRNQGRIEDALSSDLGRTRVESYLCDIGPCLVEINEAIRGLRRWSRPEHHYSGLYNFPSIITKVYKVPYGITLIISPFNFPILLAVGALTASISGGNTAIVKTSSKSPACTEVLQEIISEIFPPEYVTVIGGGHEVADSLLDQRFDKIFYTGSPKIGRHILEKAALNLTPVALELGGENGNWCIVRKDADIRDAARKIAFIKTLNAGQICININQVAVAEEVADEFLRILKEEFARQGRMSGEKYPHLINAAAFGRCSALSEKYRDKIICGGTGNPETLEFQSTVIYPVGEDEDIVKSELFNPILPVVPFKDAETDRLLDVIAGREHPLALYLFTKDVRWARKTMQSLQFGGGCINEVCVHLMVKGAPFGGTGHSGMGAYHGEWGFREFTHPQTVLLGSPRFNLSLREHPYCGKAEKSKLFLLRMLEK